MKSKGSFLTSGFEIRYNGAMVKETFLSLEEWMKKHRLPLMPVIWGITCLIIGVLVLTGLQGYSSAEKEMARQFNTQQLILAQQAARGIESFLQEIRETALLLTLLPEIQNFREGKSREGRETILRKFYESFSGKIQLLFLASANGERVSSYPPEARKKLGEREIGSPFRAKGGGLPEQGRIQFVFPQNAGSEAGKSKREVSALITIPVFRGGEFLGILGCLLDFSPISERFIATLRSGKTGGAWMINQEGRFVAHYETEMVGQDAFSARRDRKPNFSYERIDRIMREEMLRG
ncbi:MAG: hypothetical protein EHM27_04390, partial [Deltaproteobacteria bacterium]